MRAQPQVPSLCIDETSLSCGELYTVVTNRADVVAEVHL